MQTSGNSSARFAVYDKAFICQVSLEVAEMQPSLLFESEDWLGLHALVSAHARQVSSIQDAPFTHFNFQSPSGHYHAVKVI